MNAVRGNLTGDPATAARAEVLFQEQRLAIYRHTDRMFAGLLGFQWLAGILAAMTISPRAWRGDTSWIHPHVWAASVLGGVIVSLPIGLALAAPGRMITRHCVAVGQMLVGSLLIHLMGGRIEAHFHIFGSLAFLAFYRDWKLLLTASIVVACDHCVRGMLMPRSVFGVSASEPWRWLEHIGWVSYEDIFLAWSCRRGVLEMRVIANRRADREVLLGQVERQVQLRTALLRESEARKDIVFESALDAIVTLDHRGRVVEVNSAAERMLGYPRELVLGRVFDEMIVPIDGRSSNGDNLARLLARDGDRAIGHRFEIDLQRADATEFPAEVSINPVCLDGTLMAYTAFLRDITERKQAERRLAYQASHDGLTGLPNRARFQADLETCFRNMDGLALMMIDLDRFKEINDILGHHVGDLVLRLIGPRMQDVLKGRGTIARLGGDEFAILLPGAGQAQAVMMAEHLLEAMRQPITAGGHSLDVGASIGIALSPDHACEPSELLQYADAAMYSAKRSKAGYQLYASDQAARTPRRLEMVGELRRGIEQGQLLLHYQPKIDLKTGRVEGAEALARWLHPREGLLPPSRFIGIAEDTGLIKPLTLWAIQTALLQSRAWHQSGMGFPIAVNLTAEILAEPDLAKVVARLLESSDALPNWLTLEVTESAIMTDPGQGKRTLSLFRDMGVRIAIDDFGTGYSSLAYLRDLPADEVKIDRHFVRDVVSNPKSAFIVRSVVDLAKNLGLRVVAEGAEDKATVDMLASMNCDSVQGFYFSRPLTPFDFAARFACDLGHGQPTGSINGAAKSGTNPG